MSKCGPLGAALLGCALCSTVAIADGWVDFVEETTSRMPTDLNDPSVSTADTQEKDYAWGDVDNDGDIDMVSARKQPFTSTGKDTNVLFMNEGIAEGHAFDGVFVDRTGEYASLSDVGGDNGFLTPTNDRDVLLHDLNNDGWLDIITATTLTDNQAKHLSHPRIYMNLGEDAGVWMGFRHEDARIPQMHATAGPRFCSVSAGDVTGDGFADLYFGDYDSGGSQIFDFNNRLLINDGTGHFTDQSSTRLTAEMREAAFGAASVIADINNDGRLDIVKQTSLNAPTHIAVTYNDPNNEGFFNAYDTIYDLAPYFVSVGDLNQDGRLDLVITDDGTDRYMLNNGWGSNGIANFTAFTFAGSEGFGSNSIIADLNNDGHQDVIIADVDVDIGGCTRTTLIYRNLGNNPNVGFQVQGEIIPNSMLQGVHDVGVFDIDGNGRLDLVIGSCVGTRIWMNQAPTGLVFSYPDGLPSSLEPDVETTIDIEVSAFGGGQMLANSLRIWYSIGQSGFIPAVMQDLGEDVFRATLPGLPCTTIVNFYVTATMESGTHFYDPPGAPGSTFFAIFATGTEVTLRDDIEGDVSGWTVYSDASLTSGEWEAGDPNGTILDGVFAAPDIDATAGAGNVRCWVTDNLFTSFAGLADVDGGPTFLETPMFSLEGVDATISYSRWHFCNEEGTPLGDNLITEISNDGGDSWLFVHETTGTGSAWESIAFRASDMIDPTANMKLRFVSSDSPNNAITESGVDNFQVEEILCGPDCPGDIDLSGDVGFNDLVALLSAWGPCVDCAADLDGSGDVGFADLVALLAAWGPCV